MILSNKEKTGKLCNTKSGRHTHVEDMSCARQRRCAELGGFGGIPPQENFYFQRDFLDFQALLPKAVYISILAISTCLLCYTHCLIVIMK